MAATRILGSVAVAFTAIATLAAGSDRERRSGTIADRGRANLVGLDKVRADEAGLQPVVQFLTFLQDRRGDPSHLLFVREADIHDLARASGEDANAFLGRLDQLGVVVSAN